MRVGSKPPMLLGTYLVEWRARRIADPIERLRYLRQATGTGGSPHLGLGWLRRHWKTAILAIALLLIKMQTVSDASVGVKRDLQLPFGRPATAIASNAEAALPNIWVVERTKEFETYSNGLRIENRFSTHNEPRHYVVFSHNPADPLVTDPRSEPVGIVFHTSESKQLPFEAGRNRALRRLGDELLEYVKQKKSYNFVIDRFGRIFRVVAESDTANHAGKSIWADPRGLYVNLNQSFLAVSFEAQSNPGEEAPTVNAAQIYSARMLTEMFRGKYRLPAANCVTHAQVSVNSQNMRIGYHTDWAGNFPFAEVGLPDNYSLPLPSLVAFGFGYDPSFVKSTGARLWKGLLLAEEQVRQEATKQGMPVTRYRTVLQQRYREISAALKTQSALEESEE